MSSSAKFVPTLGGRVWRLQRQGAQTMSAAMKGASESVSNYSGSYASSSSASASSAMQKSAYSTSTGFGEKASSTASRSSIWAQRN